MIFKFRMLSDEADNFVRDYEVPYDMNLADFYDYIRDSVGFTSDGMASIFTSDVEWEKLREFTLLDMGFDQNDADPENDIYPPVPMANVGLGQIIHEKFDRLIYVYDMFAERQFFIELLESKFSEDGVVYPRVVDSAGDPPQQFRDDIADPADSIFEEAMDEFNTFEGDELYDDEL